MVEFDIVEARMFYFYAIMVKLKNGDRRRVRNINIKSGVVRVCLDLWMCVWVCVLVWVWGCGKSSLHG